MQYYFYDGRRVKTITGVPSEVTQEIEGRIASQPKFGHGPDFETLLMSLTTPPVPMVATAIYGPLDDELVVLFTRSVLVAVEAVSFMFRDCTPVEVTEDSHV